MKNKNNWKPTIYLVKNDKLEINYKKLSQGSYIPIKIGEDINNRILRKYLKGKMLDLGCGNIPYYEFYKNYIDENICVDWENTLHKNEFILPEQPLGYTVVMQKVNEGNSKCLD